MNTHSGRSKDTGNTKITLANPGKSLRYNTLRSTPPVSALAHSRGPEKGKPRRLHHDARQSHCLVLQQLPALSQTTSTPGFSFVLVSHSQLQLFCAVLGPSLSSVSKLLRRRATDCIWETSVCGQLLKFWHVWNLLPQSIRLRLSVLVPYWGRLRKVKFILDVLR